MTYYAHSTQNPDKSDWEELDVHLRAVASRAAAFARPFGCEKAAGLAGLLHDLGKYSEAFQHYIASAGAAHGPDHSTAGAREVLTLASGLGDKLIAELLAYGIAGHHAGLPDRTAESASLSERLKKDLEPLDPVWRDEVKLDAAELVPQGFRASGDKAGQAFQLAFLGRMLFSSLVDADFLETEAFYARVDGRAVDRTWPQLRDNIDRLIALYDCAMTKKRAHAEATPLNALRDDILAHGRAKAVLPPGVFTLDVPTGGGKTLASLGFALDHAKHWGMERILYAIPFTSIIDQTAAIFRDLFGQDIVLEHHSAIETRDWQEKADDGKSDAKLRLAMENWAAPLVVTTNVQLFESLFASRTSRCRKLHNLTKSVIILDEAQMISLHVLRPCVAALHELTQNYSCSIVLCTATQPALIAPKFVGGFELGPERELAPNPPTLHAKLKRVTLRQGGTMTDEALVDAMRETYQALVIVNSRGHALALYRAAQAAGLDGLVHLTTRQVTADRRSILAEVRETLTAQEPCRLIATSLIEAGVDVDFPRVWRAEAGLDQIIQAAGRCNREGKRTPEESMVTVFKPAEAKSPREIQAFAAAMDRVARKHPDLQSQNAIADYFKEVYWQRGEGLDKHNVLEDFGVSAGRTDFAYRTVAEKFRLIESGMEPVIVPIDKEAKDVLAALASGRMLAGTAARKLQVYTVQVPPRSRQNLIENHADLVGPAGQFVVLRTAGLYTREIGLHWEKADELGEEQWMI